MFKRLSATAILLLISCASAFATSCFVSENQAGLTAGMQVAELPAIGTSQNITTSGTSAQTTNAIGTAGESKKLIFVWCDTQSAVETGTNPTASVTTSHPIGAGQGEYIIVPAGSKVAAILRPTL